jgi:hypothetical protein
VILFQPSAQAIGSVVGVRGDLQLRNLSKSHDRKPSNLAGRAYQLFPLGGAAALACVMTVGTSPTNAQYMVARVVRLFCTGTVYMSDTNYGAHAKQEWEEIIQINPSTGHSDWWDEPLDVSDTEFKGWKSTGDFVTISRITGKLDSQQFTEIQGVGIVWVYEGLCKKAPEALF